MLCVGMPIFSITKNSCVKTYKNASLLFLNGQLKFMQTSELYEYKNEEFVSFVQFLWIVKNTRKFMVKRAPKKPVNNKK